MIFWNLYLEPELGRLQVQAVLNFQGDPRVPAQLTGKPPRGCALRLGASREASGFWSGNFGENMGCRQKS